MARMRTVLAATFHPYIDTLVVERCTAVAASQGDSEDAVMSNWVVLHDHLQGKGDVGPGASRHSTGV